MHSKTDLIGPHGGYRQLKSYQNTEIIYDATLAFCNRFIHYRSRTHDQMVQAARSGKQNIAEGSMASGTSKKTELKLVGIARASLEELLLDYEDFLRQKQLTLWAKDEPKAYQVRQIVYLENRSYKSYRTYIEGEAAETQSWLEYSVKCEYMTRAQGKKLHKIYDQIIGKLVTMGNQPETFLLGKTAKPGTRAHSPASSPPHPR